MPITIVGTRDVCSGIAAPGRAAPVIHAVPGKSEGKTVAQVAPVGDDARDNASLGLVGDQHVDLIKLVHRDELQDLDADRAVSVARKRRDKLETLGGLVAANLR